MRNTLLHLALTTECCTDIIDLLTKKRGWTIARIAKTINSPAEYVRRVQGGKQSFQLTDVEALACALKQSTAMLIFNSMNKDRLAPDSEGLHDLARQEVKRHAAFRRAFSRKHLRKRGSRATAA